MAAGTDDCPPVFENTSITVSRGGRSPFTPPPPGSSGRPYLQNTALSVWSNVSGAFHAAVQPGCRDSVITVLTVGPLSHALYARVLACLPGVGMPLCLCYFSDLQPTGQVSLGAVLFAPPVLAAAAWSFGPERGSRIIDSSLASPTLQLQDNEKM